MSRKVHKKGILNEYCFDIYCYGFEIHYDEDRPCMTGDECCEDMCRCRVISDAVVTTVNLNDLVMSFWPKASEWEMYCIERILTFHRMWSPDSWNVAVDSDYYGDEIEGIYCHNATIIDDQIAKLLSLSTNKEMIEFVLDIEYGYLAKSIVDREWSIETVDKSKIVKREFDLEWVERYTGDSNLPRGVCVLEGDHYRVIDGNHRLSAIWSNNKINEVKIIVARNAHEESKVV